MPAAPGVQPIELEVRTLNLDCSLLLCSCSVLHSRPRREISTGATSSRHHSHLLPIDLRDFHFPSSTVNHLDLKLTGSASSDSRHYAPIYSHASLVTTRHL